jgi:hypothetical protein
VPPNDPNGDLCVLPRELFGNQTSESAVPAQDDDSRLGHSMSLKRAKTRPDE